MNLFLSQNSGYIYSGYISNGNMSNTLHHDSVPILLNRRLIFSIECADALGYMHLQMLAMFKKIDLPLLPLPRFSPSPARQRRYPPNSPLHPWNLTYFPGSDPSSYGTESLAFSPLVCLLKFRFRYFSFRPSFARAASALLELL